MTARDLAGKQPSAYGVWSAGYPAEEARRTPSVWTLGPASLADHWPLGPRRALFVAAIV